MSWQLMSTEPVTFEQRVFDDFLIGDELIKIEHNFSGATFPGMGYAMLSNLYANSERDFFRRSYPYKTSPRIYEIKVPSQLVAAGYVLHQLVVQCNLRARVQADANWQISAYRWVGGPIDPTFNFDGDPDPDGTPDGTLDGAVAA